MSNGKLTGTEFRNEFLRSLNILAPRIARAIEIYGEDTVDVVNFASSGTATLNNLSVTGLTDIVSDATTEDVLDITADSLTTANVIDISADALTTGTILNLVSDSSDTTARSLVNIINDNSSATNVTCLTVRNDGTMATTAPTALIHDAGDMSGDAHATLELRYENASGGRQAMLEFNQAGSTSTDDDDIGLITATALNSADEKTTYCQIEFDASDKTDGDEGGEIIFQVMAGGTAGTAAMSELFTIGAEDVATFTVPSVIVNEAGINCDFRVEGDTETHLIFADASLNRVSIGDSTDSPAATLEVTNASDGGVPLVQLNSNDVDQIALDINAANTTANVIDIQADALTTGAGVNIVSNSSDNGARSIVFVHNDHASATGTACVKIVQDAPSTTALRIESTDNTTSGTSNFGPIVILDRQNDTVADGMGVGLINFEGQDDAGAGVGYARISAEASDVSDGAGKGKLILRVQQSVTTTEPNAVEEIMSLDGGNASTGPSVVINDLSYDVDFRVETNATTHALFVDGGSDHVRIDAAQGLHLKDLGGHADTPASGYGVIYVNGDVPYFKTDGGTETSMIAGGSGASAPLTLTNASDSGSPALTIANNDVDEQALDINAANTTAEVVSIVASSLTTGKALDVYSNSSNGGERDLVRIKNDSAFADATTLLRIHNDADPDDTPEGATMVIEHNFNTNNRNNLALTSTGVTGTTCAALSFQKTTTSEADDGFLGIIRFQGNNSNNDLHEYAAIVGVSSDVTDGDEGGLIKLIVHAGGTAGTADFTELLNIGGEDVANGTVPAVVVNEDGINCDFRVESDGEDEAIFLDASAETLYINKGESAFTTQIHNTNDVAISVDATGVVINEDGHNTNDFRAETTDNSTMFYVGAATNTVSVGGKSSHHDADFAVFNDYNGTTFENKITDGDYGSAEILKYSPGADDTLTVGQLYFLHTDGTWNSTDADAVATGASQMLCVGLGAARTVGVLIRGFVRIPSTEILNVPGSGAVDGLPVYISTTAGHFDFTAPSASGDFVRIVGYAIDDDSGDVLVYFNPDATFVEIA